MGIEVFVLNAATRNEIFVRADSCVVLAVSAPRELAVDEAHAVGVWWVVSAEDHHNAQVDIVKGEGYLRVELPLRPFWIPLHDLVRAPLRRLEIVGAAEARANRANSSVALRSVAAILVPLDIRLAATVWLPPYRASTTGIAWAKGAPMSFREARGAAAAVQPC